MEAKPDGRRLAFLALSSRKRYQHVSDLLESLYSQHSPKRRERGLARELAYGVLRTQSRLDWLLECVSKGYGSRTNHFLKSILRLGAYQLISLDRVPEYAAVDASVSMAKEFEGRKAAGFVNAVLRKLLRNREALTKVQPKGSRIRKLSHEYSHPQWMIKRWEKEFGSSETKALLSWNNTRPQVVLRARNGFWRNLRRELKELHLEPVWCREPYCALQKAGDPARLTCVQKGMAYVQNPASGLVCDLVAASGGERLLDMCAAPGGKSLNLADSLGASGAGGLLAADISPARLEKLRAGHGAQREGPVLLAMDGCAASFRESTFDAVLVDAPCSNTGVLGKRVEARWDRKPRDIGRLAELQLKLLCSAAGLLKPGGRMVYSTCSLEKEENEGVVERFLRIQPSFELINANLFVDNNFTDAAGFLRVLPFKHRLDGMFGARLERRG